MRIEPINDNYLLKNYVNILFNRDQKHPKNQNYGAITDFKGYPIDFSSKSKFYTYMIGSVVVATIVFLVLSFRHFDLNMIFYE